MFGVCRVAGPIRFRSMLAYLVLLLFPVGLVGQEVQVTLYTPAGSQQRTLSTPMIVDVGLPRPMEAPASAVVGTGTGTRITEVEIVVSEGAGGQATVSYEAGPVLALAADASGNVWAGTPAGLSRFDGQQWTTFTQADGLVDGAIYSLAVDGQRHVWARGLNGLSRFDGQHWTRYQFEELRRRRSAVPRRRNVVAIAPNGDVWCTGHGDVLLTRFDGQDWWAYNHDDVGSLNIIEDSVHYFSVANIAIDQSGTLWAAAEFYATASIGSSEQPRRHLFSFNGTQWKSYEFGSEWVDGDHAKMIFTDRQGRVWVDCWKGVCVKDGSIWKRYDEVIIDGYPHWNVDGMAEDAAGRLWIADGYFGVLEGTTWIGFPYEEFAASFYVAPVIDSRGDLWIPSRGGLYWWHQSDLPTAIESASIPGEPRSFHLEQNYPNPFNHTTYIGFTLQQLSVVSLKVFNTHGQLVATLVEGIRPAGTYQNVWDGRDDRGQAVSSGAYIVRLLAEGQQATRKMLLVQ